MKTKKKMLLPLLIAVIAICTSIGIGGIFSASAATTTVDKDAFVGEYFTAIGDTYNDVDLSSYVNDVSYADFTAANFSGGGVMVETRNKAVEYKDVTDNDNNTNPKLLEYFPTRYPVGVKFNPEIDITDNTADDTLIELAFPGENDNDQAKGIKIMIADAENPGIYIALFVWYAYGNNDATSGKAWLAAAAGTWEALTSGPDVYISDAGYDTDGGFLKVGDAVNDDGAPGSNEGCFLNYKEHGHEKTDVKLSRASAQTLKVKFDNTTGKLYINEVLIRQFKDYSADGTHFYEGFTTGRVKLSVGVIKTVRCSTDEFTRFCIMNIDGNSLKADSDGNISYNYNGYSVAPESGLIASGITAIPAPLYYGLDGTATPVETGVTVDITDPNGNKTENCSATDYDFDLVGTYTIEYFVNGASVGTANYTTAVKGDENELAEAISFGVSENLFVGKKITLADFTLTTDEAVAIESATVKIYAGDTLVATETADAEWEYTLADKGEITFKVTGDAFSLKTSATVLPGIYPSAAIENGSVTINGAGDAVGLVVGTNDFVITPAHGYKLASLTIAGDDVTEEVIDGEYTFNAETAEDNVIYTVVFEKLPDVTVTFTADGETLATVGDIVNGTLFGEVTAPEIPEKAGYDVIGWNIAANYALTENVTAEAVYEVKTYTITFDTDGGSQIAAKQYTAIETVEEISEVPEKTGFVFDAWYLGNEKYVFGGKLTADITLTAKYNVKKITVTVKSADFEDVVLTIDYNTAVSAEDLGAKSGYEFKGLFTDEDLTVEYNGAGFTEDTVLYASYSKESGGCASGIGGGFGIAMVIVFAAAYLAGIKSKKVKEN